jgi:disulfide oxidoreductase YuzD
MKRYEIWLKLDGKERQEASAASADLAKREANGLKDAYKRQYPRAKVEVEVRDLNHDATTPGGKVIFTA